MIERIPEPEALKFPIPQSLLPKEEGPAFPTLTANTLRQLAENGWKRLGILVLVTGGMRHKVESAFRMTRIAKRISIVSGKDAGAILKVLDGEQVGTCISA